MQFLYHQNSGEKTLNLKGEEFQHLKVRRVRENEYLFLRNLKDQFLYEYKIHSLTKNSCILNLIKKSFTNSNPPLLSLALGVIDTKTLEKTLPFLNELGVKKLILVYTEFSQRNFKIDLERLEKIIINSCEQCGRIFKMELEFFDNVEEFLKLYPCVVLVDFEGKHQEFSKDKLYFIGPEGGFSLKERQQFKEKISFKNKNILKSHTALIALASKILL